MSRIWPSSFGALASLVLFLAACEQAPGPSEPASGEGVVYHRGNTAEPASLDPHRLQGVEEMTIANDLFLGLMTDAADASPLYGAARSHEINEDGTVYTFAMREGHVWSDGAPVTAADFVFAYRRFLNPETAAQYAALFYPIKNARAVNAGDLPPEALGVSAPDPGTLVIELERPAPYLLELLTLPPAFPVPEHVIAGHGADWVKRENFVSNGPFRLGEWRPNDYIRMEKNPLFFDAENVRIDTVYAYPTDLEIEGHPDAPLATIR